MFDLQHAADLPLACSYPGGAGKRSPSKTKRACSQYCLHCFLELQNGITRQLSTSELPPSPEVKTKLTERHFAEAVRRLNESFVGNMSQVRRFVDHLPIWRSPTSRCKMPHINPTSFYWGNLTSETGSLIAAANHYDMRLYSMFS